MSSTMRRWVRERSCNVSARPRSTCASGTTRATTTASVSGPTSRRERGRLGQPAARKGGRCGCWCRGLEGGGLGKRFCAHGQCCMISTIGTGLLSVKSLNRGSKSGIRMWRKTRLSNSSTTCRPPIGGPRPSGEAATLRPLIRPGRAGAPSAPGCLRTLFS